MHVCSGHVHVCHHCPLPNPGSGDGLVPLAMGQGLVKLGHLCFKPQNTKKLGKEKELEGWEGGKAQPPGSAHSCPTYTRACPIPTPVEGFWELGHRSKALYQSGLPEHPEDLTSEDSKH